jgi:hypothetical protein
MPSQFSLRVIHPAFELLKRSAPVLHFIAASIILLNGLHHFNSHHISRMICYCQLLIATDIYLLLFFITLGMLADVIYLNCIFRFIEAVTLLGIGFLLIRDGHHLPGAAHFLLAAGYAFIFYREYRIQHSEAVDIRPTGITIPNFKADAEIGWQDIKTVVPRYHSIVIETFRNKKIQFQLRNNLNIEALQLIDDFCRRHQRPAEV